MKIYKNGHVLTGEGFKRLDIAEEGGRIVKLAADIMPCEGSEEVDCTGKRILPALVDIHTHGANGYDFNTADKDGMRRIIEFYKVHGVGSVLPTVMTDSDENICGKLKIISELSKEYREIKGIHLEGPFLSEKFCGAMPVKYLQAPSVEKFMEYRKAAGGLIKIITLAPELEGAEEFIRAVTKMGVVVSLGHSAADGESVSKAIAAGAKSFTHWGNAMSRLDRHNLNMSGSAMLSDNFCEVICDGKHVERDVLRLLIKTKGTDKVIGITDSIMATGLADGMYTLAGQEVKVEGGDARLTSNGVRAGSTLDAFTGLKNVMDFTGLDITEAIKLWTINPATLLGLEKDIGSISEGKEAAFIIE